MSQEEHQTTVDEGTPQGALALPDQNLPQRVYLIPVRAVSYTHLTLPTTPYV